MHLNVFFSGNRIFQGQAAGIAVNENGRGLIVGMHHFLLATFLCYSNLFLTLSLDSLLLQTAIVENTSELFITETLQGTRE